MKFFFLNFSVCCLKRSMTQHFNQRFSKNSRSLNMEMSALDAESPSLKRANRNAAHLRRTSKASSKRCRWHVFREHLFYIWYACTSWHPVMIVLNGLHGFLEMISDSWLHLMNWWTWKNDRFPTPKWWWKGRVPWDPGYQHGTSRLVKYYEAFGQIDVFWGDAPLPSKNGHVVYESIFSGFFLKKPFICRPGKRSWEHPKILAKNLISQNSQLVSLGKMCVFFIQLYPQSTRNPLQLCFFDSRGRELASLTWEEKMLATMPLWYLALIELSSTTRLAFHGEYDLEKSSISLIGPDVCGKPLDRSPWIENWKVKRRVCKWPSDRGRHGGMDDII